MNKRNGACKATQTRVTAARTPALTSLGERSYHPYVSVFSVKSIGKVLNTHSGLLCSLPVQALGNKEK